MTNSISRNQRIIFPVPLASINFTFDRFKVIHTGIKLRGTNVTIENYKNRKILDSLQAKNFRTGYSQENKMASDNYFRTIKLLGTIEWLTTFTMEKKIVEIGPLIDGLTAKECLLGEKSIKENQWNIFHSIFKDNAILYENSLSVSAKKDIYSKDEETRIKNLLINERGQFELENLISSNSKALCTYLIQILKNTVLIKSIRDEREKKRVRTLVDSIISLLNNCSYKSKLQRNSDIHYALSQAYIQKVTLRNLGIAYEHEQTLFKDQVNLKTFKDQADLTIARNECEKAIEYYKRSYMDVVGEKDPELSNLYFQLGLINEKGGPAEAMAQAYLDACHADKSNTAAENKIWTFFPVLYEAGILSSPLEHKLKEKYTDIKKRRDY